jgi:hypothetical protein
MLAAVSALRICAFAQTNAGEPVKTTVCEIAKHPEAFDGKVVRVRALVEAGMEDLPEGVADESCGAELKLFAPDDPHFARLVKSKEFRKLVKEVKKNPVVEATVTGLFKRAAGEQKPDQKLNAGLALESVEDVVVFPQPRARGQKR